MGNLMNCSISNQSEHNIRVLIQEKSVDLDDILISKPGAVKVAAGGAAGEDEKMNFRKNTGLVRIPASETRDVAWSSGFSLSMFVEEDDDKNVCAKELILNKPLHLPCPVLVYDM